MFSTRFFTFLFFVVAFGMFALAKPVAVTRVDNTITAERLLALIVELKAKILVLVPLLDGKNKPDGPINDIIVLVKAFVTVLATVHVDLGGLGDLVAEIVANVLEIVNAILGGLLKYNGLDANSSLIQDLIHILVTLVAKLTVFIPGVLLAQVLAVLQAHINLPIKEIVQGLITLLKNIL